jgi:sugar lactone lactonase YvrE
MSNSDKNILITPGTGSTSVLPSITFTGAGNSAISLKVYDDDILSFETDAVKMLSMTDESDSIQLSVNSDYGIPSLEVGAAGTIVLGKYGQFVGVNSTSPTTNLDIVGDVNITGSLSANRIGDIVSNIRGLYRTTPKRKFTLLPYYRGAFNIRGIGFGGTDGRNLYIVNDNNDRIFHFNLSTGYDLETLSYVSEKDIGFATTENSQQTQDIYIKPDGTSIYTSDLFTDRIHQYNLSTPFDLTTAGVGTGPSVFENEESAGALTFKPDGTKVYFSGNTRDMIYQGTLTTPWDINSYVGVDTSVGVGVREARPEGVTFKSDGTKMYLIGSSGDIVLQYALSTAWRVGTAIFEKQFSVSSQDNAPRDITFKSDGTVMYIIGNQNNSVRSYTLSTAWDIGTASFTATFSVSSQSTSPTAISFRDNGSRMFVLSGSRLPDGVTSDQRLVHQYNLSSNWDITSAGFSTSYNFDANRIGSGNIGIASTSVTQLPREPQGLAFKSDGTAMYVADFLTKQVHQYTLSSAWAVDSARDSGKILDTIGSGIGYLTGISFDTTGTILYVVDDYFNRVHQYYLSIAWDITTATTTKGNFYNILFENNIESMRFNNNGTKLIVLGRDNSGFINSYNLTTPYDISTLSWEKRVLIGNSVGIEFYGMDFSHDGTKLYLYSNDHKYIYQLDLSTPYDISTFTFDDDSTTIPRWYQVNIYGLNFSPDGLKMYTLSTNEGVGIAEYSLAQPWNIKSPAFVRRKVFQQGSWEGASEFNEPSLHSLYFKPDGTKVFFSALSTDKVYSFDLEIPWNIATAFEPITSFYIGEQSIQTRGVDFSTDGTKFYVNDEIENKVFEYVMSTPWDIKTASYNNVSFQLDDSLNYAIAFRKDGKAFYISGVGNETVGTASSIILDRNPNRRIYEYALTTPWELRTAYATGNYFDYSNYDQQILSMYVRPDNSEFYFAGNVGRRIWKFKFPTQKKIIISGNTELTGDLNVYQNLNVSGETISYTGLFTKLGIGTDPDYQSSTDFAVRRNAKIPNIGSKASLSKIRRVDHINASKSYVFRGPNREQPRNVYGYAFKTDGTKLYVNGYVDGGTASGGGQAVWEYTLSTPFDVTTITSSKPTIFYEQNIYSIRAFGITFSDNGNSFYLMNAATDSQYAAPNYIMQYNMTTAWDTSTAQPAKTFYPGNQFNGVSVRSLKFNNDGTRMYLLGVESGVVPTQEIFVVQYDLTTPYDITTAKYSFIYDITWHNWSENTALYSVFFKPDGKEMWIGGAIIAGTLDNRGIVHYRLKTAWDLRTAYFVGDLGPYSNRVFNLAPLGLNDGTLDFGFNSSGTRFYSLVNGGQRKEIRQFELSTPYDLFSIKAEPNRGFDNYYNRVVFKPDGSKVYFLYRVSGGIDEYFLKTPWNIDSIEARSARSIDFRRYFGAPTLARQGVLNYYDFQFKPDGTKLYLLSAAASFYGFEEYTLTNPWDFSRLRKTGEINFNRKYALSGTHGFNFKPDGKKILCLSSTHGDRIVEIDLANPWDINTASYPSDWWYTYEVSQPNAVGFGSTGFDMYICDQNPDRVFQYKLSTAYDVTTAQWTGLQTSFTTTDNTIRDAYVGAGGTYLYVVGGQTNRIYQYSLSNNNIQTVGLVTSFGTTVLTTPPNSGMNEATPLGVTFKSDGTVMYIVGNASNSPAGQMYQNPRRIHQFTLSTPWNVATAGFSTYFNVTIPAMTGREAGTWASNEFWKLRFKPDGNRMYLLDRGTYNVHQFDLGQSWNAPSATHVGSFYVAHEEYTQPYGMDISADGTKLYIIGFNMRTVFQYTLTTPWDVTTAKINKGKRSSRLSGEGSFGKYRQPTSQVSFRMSTDGLTAYIVDQPSANIPPTIDSNSKGTFVYEFDFGKAWDTRTVGLTTYYEVPNTPDLADFYIRPDRKRLYALLRPETGLAYSRLEEYEYETYDDNTNISGQLNVGSVNVDSELFARRGTFEGVGIGSSSYNSELVVRGNSNLRTIGNEFDIRELTAENNQYLRENTLWLMSGEGRNTTRSRGTSISNAWGLAFSSDGTSMYVQNRYSDNGWVEQYRLSTPWNVTTGTISTSFWMGDYDQNNSTHQGDRDSRSITFKPDGTALYVVGLSSDRVYQYNLTTPWNLASVGTAQTYFVGSSRGGSALFMQTPVGIALSSTGTSMFVLDYSTRDLTEFTLASSPWNVGIATTTGKSFNVYTVYTNSDWGSTQFEYYPTAVYFKPDGTKFWISGERGHAIYEFSMSTPWNIGVATETYSRLYVPDYGAAYPRGLSFSNDGRTLYFISEPTSRVHQVGLTTAWDIGSAIKPTTPSAIKTLNYFTPTALYAPNHYPYSLNFSPDGKKMIVGAGEGLMEYDLPIPWAVGFSTFMGKSGNWYGNNPVGTSYNSGVCFSKNGKKVYVGGNAQTIFEFDAIEPWSVIDLKYVASFNAGPYVAGRVGGLNISDDGTKMYVSSDHSSGAVTQLDLSVPYSITSAKCLDDSFTVIGKQGPDNGDEDAWNQPAGVYFKPDGTTFYTFDRRQNYISQYTCGISTFEYSKNAWDVRTGTYSTTVYISGVSDGRGFTMSDNGTRAYITDYTGQKIYQVNLNTAWDLGSVGSAGIAKTFSLSGGYGAYNPTGIYFRSSAGAATTMFVMDYGNHRINEYALSSASDVSTASFVNYTSVYPLDPTYWNDTDGRVTAINPTGLFFKPDGTEVYVQDWNKNAINRFKLRTPWNITTMYRHENMYADSEIGFNYLGYNPSGLFFKPDGTKLYSVGGMGGAYNNTTHDRILQFTLTTPWEIGTVKKLNDKIITFGWPNDWVANPIGQRIGDIQFAAGGKKLFLLSYADSNSSIMEYELDSPWEINTYKITNKKFTTLPYGNNFKSLYIKPDGSKFYIGEVSYGYITELDCPTNEIDLVGKTNVRGDLNVEGSANVYGELNSLRGNFTSVGIGVTAYDVSMTVVGKADISNIGNEVEFASNIGYDFDGIFTYDVGLNRSKTGWGGEEQAQYGFAFSIDGLNLYKTGQSNRAVYQWKLSKPYDLRTAKYYFGNKVSTISPSIQRPFSIKFKDDGTVMYVVCGFSTAVYQYALPTPWDITTVGAATSFNVASRDITPRGLAFGNNGSVMYVSGEQNDKVYQFSLGTAWNVTTASYSTEYTVSVDPSGVGLNTTGTKLFVNDRTNGRVIEYGLGTPWNVSTAGLTTVFSILNQGNEPTFSYDLHFSYDGSKMFTSEYYYCGVYGYDLPVPYSIRTGVGTTSAQRTAGLFNFYRNAPLATHTPATSGFYMRPDRQKMYTTSSRIVYEYTFGTPNNFRTVGITSTVSLTSSMSYNSNGLTFSPDGTRMFVVDRNNDSNTKIVEYSLSSPWNITSPGVAYTHPIGRIGGVNNVGRYYRETYNIEFNADGTKYYLSANTDTYAISEWITKTPYRLEGSQPRFESLYTASQDNNPTGIFWTPDGTRFFTLGNQNDTIYQYDVPIDKPFDIRNAAYNGVSYSVAVRDTNPYQITFKPDGTKMYIMGNLNDSVYEFNLATAWSISSVTYVGAYSVTNQQADPSSLRFSSDGKLMFVAGRGNGNQSEIHQYILATPWSVTTAYYSNVMQNFYYTGFSASAYRQTNWFNIEFSPDGTKLYTHGWDQNRIFHYELEKPWDITTLRHQGTFTYYTRNQQSRGDVYPSQGAWQFVFKPDGTKFWVIDSARSTVYTYYLETPWKVSTAYLPGIAHFDFIAYPYNFTLSYDGKKIYVCNQDRMREYTLKRPGEIHSYIFKDWYDDNFNRNTSFHVSLALAKIQAMPDGETIYAIHGTSVFPIKLNNLKKVAINNSTIVNGDLNVRQTITAYGGQIDGSLSATSLGIGTVASGVAGEIRATNNVTAYYSDDRLKIKLGNIDNALDKVCTLNGFYYEANELAQSLGYVAKREVGVSAQEVEKILPEIVTSAPIDERFKTIYYDKLIPLLIEAIKEQQHQINKLNDEINDLKGKCP